MEHKFDAIFTLNFFLQEKEYATENLLFVEAVWNMKKLSQRDVADECRRIWQQFLAQGADMLVNIDSKSHKITQVIKK